MRIEKDSMGPVEVPSERKWGAQTQRSYNNFKIGQDKMPYEMIESLVEIKRAAALVNHDLGKLSEERMNAITEACDKVLTGNYKEEFPLSVWQTGSGTQTNMNVNEVLAHLSQGDLHPNDDINMSQSSNDVFPTAMHISGTRLLVEKLIPALDLGIEAFRKIEEENRDIIKIGRTHLQDAVPLRFSDEVSAWTTMLEENKAQIKVSLPFLQKLTIGGTAVGTGLNTPEGFGEKMAEELSKRYSIEFTASENKFHSMTSKDAMVFAHGALKALASNLYKIANDIRFLASGPRCGYGELSLPSNEPGSSIMPGKVNPTQAEALMMVCLQVMGHDLTISMGASQGNFQLNTFMPLIIYNFIDSIHLLSDGLRSFVDHCVSGIKVEKQMEAYVYDSLMLVTALNQKIGYSKAADIAKKAYEEDKTLEEVLLEEGYTKSEIKKLLNPKKMV